MQSAMSCSSIWPQPGVSSCNNNPYHQHTAAIRAVHVAWASAWGQRCPASLDSCSSAPAPAAVAGPAPDLGNFTRAGCDNFTGHTHWEPLRPAYHITVPYGWMNDPHGMFQRKDTVHLFFQYNPRDLAWGESPLSPQCTMSAACSRAHGTRPQHVPRRQWASP
jgi:hypothetical protein